MANAIHFDESQRMRTIAGIPAGDIVDTKTKEGLSAPWYARPLLNVASSWHRLNAWGANIDVSICCISHFSN